MDETTRHLDEILTHLTSDAIWKIFEVMAALVVGERIRKSGIISLRSKIAWSSLATLLLLLFVWSALEAHHQSGFINGAVFATSCGVSLFLVLAIIYSFIKKFLPIGLKRLEWAKDRTLWTVEHSDEALADIMPSPKGLHFRASFKNDVDRWAKMEISFKEAQDYHTWAGISFDIKCDRPYPNTYIRLAVKVPSIFNDGRGSIHRVEEPVTVFNGRPMFLFQEMWQPSWSLEKHLGYWNLRQIISVAVVCNTVCDDVEFFADNFALVRFVDATSQEGAIT